MGGEVSGWEVSGHWVGGYVNEWVYTVQPETISYINHG